MSYWKVRLDCGCDSSWEEPGMSSDMPYVGHYAWCERHGDVTVAEVEPARWDWNSFTLSPDEPAQSGSPYGGWTAGDKVVVFWDTRDGSWGYCFYGVSRDGLAYESDDVTGFESAEAALEAAKANDSSQDL